MMSSETRPVPAVAGHVVRNEKENADAEGPRLESAHLRSFLPKMPLLPVRCRSSRSLPCHALCCLFLRPQVTSHDRTFQPGPVEGPFCLSDYRRCSCIIAGFLLTHEIRLEAERPAGGYRTPHLNLSPLMILSTERLPT